MKPEEQYFIAEVEVWITRDGNGCVDERHLKNEQDHQYYRVSGLETRYKIYGVYGSMENPKRIYEGPIQNECYFASSVCTNTRRYRRAFDNTYFKFYDDAEEVLININSFIEWLRKAPTMALPKVKMKQIENNNHLLRDMVDTTEVSLIRQSQIGLEVKKRSDLKGFSLHLQNELDLIQ